MKKYLYMIAALFGIDYFCKGKHRSAETGRFSARHGKKPWKDPPVPQSQRRFLFWGKKEKKELVRMVPVVFTSAAAGILTWLLCPGRRQKKPIGSVLPSSRRVV